MKWFRATWNSEKFIIGAGVITAVISPIAAILCSEGFSQMVAMRALFCTILLPILLLFRSYVHSIKAPPFVSAFRYIFEEDPIGVPLYGVTALIAMSSAFIGLLSTDVNHHLLAAVILVTGHLVASINMNIRLAIFWHRNRQMVAAKK